MLFGGGFHEQELSKRGGWRPSRQHFRKCPRASGPLTRLLAGALGHAERPRQGALGIRRRGIAASHGLCPAVCLRRHRPHLPFLRSLNRPARLERRHHAPRCGELLHQQHHAAARGTPHPVPFEDRRNRGMREGKRLGHGLRPRLQAHRCPGRGGKPARDHALRPARRRLQPGAIPGHRRIAAPALCPDDGRGHLGEDVLPARRRGHAVPHHLGIHMLIRETRRRARVVPPESGPFPPTRPSGVSNPSRP